MTWWDYVARTAGAETRQNEIAKAAGVDQSAISRWKRGGKPDPKNVILFARAYKRSPIEALLEADLIGADEANAQPRLAPNLDDVTNEQLADLVRRRLMEVGGGHEQRSPASIGAEEKREPPAATVVRRGSLADYETKLRAQLAKAKTRKDREHIQAVLDEIEHRVQQAITEVDDDGESDSA